MSGGTARVNGQGCKTHGFQEMDRNSSSLNPPFPVIQGEAKSEEHSLPACGSRSQWHTLAVLWDSHLDNYEWGFLAQAWRETVDL